MAYLGLALAEQLLLAQVVDAQDAAHADQELALEGAQSRRGLLDLCLMAAVQYRTTIIVTS